MIIEQLEPRRLLAAGDLDPTFGVGGRVESENFNKLDFLSESLVQPDGKILFAGGTWVASLGDNHYLFKRFNQDGTTDESFGDGGAVLGQFADDADEDEDPEDSYIQNIAIAPDGTIWAIAKRDLVEVLARFNADGSIDTSFGGGAGFVSAVSDGWQMEIQPDGKLLVLTSDNPRQIARYLTDGTLDPSFGGDGTVDAPLELTNALKLQGTKLVLAGREIVNDVPEFALARLNADGSLDTTFGDDGKTITPIVGGGTDTIVGTILEILPDGRILVAGTTDTEEPTAGGMAIARYDADGNIDTTFGDSGVAVISFGDGMSTNDIAVDDDGNAYVFGHGQIGLALILLTPQGQLDETFGRVVTINSTNSPFSEGIYADGIIIQDDGKLLLRGQNNYSDGGGHHNTFFLWRMLAEDDGNPAAVELNAGTLSIAGTSGDDRIDAIEIGDVIYAALNDFGRVFDTADVDVVTSSALTGDDILEMRLASVSARLSGGVGRDRIAGGDKNDTLQGNGGRDLIDGGLGADVISGGAGNDLIRGLGGGDHIYGRGGNDFLMGNGGDDRIDGGEGTDSLIGGGGDDIFLAADGDIDQLFGNDGDDSAETDEEDVLSDVESVI